MLFKFIIAAFASSVVVADSSLFINAGDGHDGFAINKYECVSTYTLKAHESLESIAEDHSHLQFLNAINKVQSNGAPGA
ncbi:MAG: hypothetical protein SGCHY_005580, partial [Lobulomycetales sp.]